jgi:hypothetical protein
MSKPRKQKITHNKNEYTLDPSKKETTSGLYVSAGEISEDYDKVTWKELLEDYTKMRNGGAVESTTVSILKYPILRAGYTITHPVPEIVEYVEWAFNCLIDSFGVKKGFREFLNHLFLSLEYGCSFFEKIYQSGIYTPDNKITNIIRRLAPFKPETIWEFHYDETMQFSGIRHERRESNSLNSFVDIPVEKLFFYSHNAEYGDPRGRSELRPVRNLFKIKTEILMSTARAQQRGAGIPEIKLLKENPTAEEKATAGTIGRTIGNMKSGYVVTSKDVELKLHGLQIQGNPEQLLEFINREMFFNTLTEFMTSGIGQSGSRSATSEHKGSYEMKCGAVTLAVEEKINLLIEEIIDISCYAGVEEYPTFKFNALQQTDIVAASDALNKFYTSSILVKQPGDEQFIRSLFNMPDKELKDGIEIIPPIVKPVAPMFDAGKVKKFSGMNFKKVLSADEQLNFVLKNFDAKAPGEYYLKTQEESESIIKDVMKKFLAYIGKQVDAGAEVGIKYDVELINRLNKLYREGHDTGTAAVKQELEKLSAKELSTEAEEKVIKTASQSITRFAGRLMFNIKTVVEDVLETEWNKEKESATEFIIKKEFENGFKTDIRTLISKTGDGYLDGRGQALVDNKENIELYFYNSILDPNLCDECAVLTGSVVTLEEAQSAGLFTGKGRVNSGCLGGLAQCRCVLMPYKLKGDFTL